MIVAVAAGYDERPWLAVLPAGRPGRSRLPAGAADPAARRRGGCLPRHDRAVDVRDVLGRQPDDLPPAARCRQPVRRRPRRRRGSAAGDRVALVLPNCAQHVIAFFAVLRLGGVVVQCNPVATRGRAAHPARRLGRHRRGLPRPGRHDRSSAIRPDTEVRTVVVTSLIESLSPAARGRLYAPLPKTRRRRAKLVADVPDDPAVVRFRTLVRVGQPGAAGGDRPGSRRRSPAVHRRDDRAAEGGDALARQPGRQQLPDAAVDARRDARPRGHPRRAAAVPRLRADAVHADHGPARRSAGAGVAVRPGRGLRRDRRGAPDAVPRRAADLSGAARLTAGAPARPEVDPGLRLRGDEAAGRHPGAVRADDRRSPRRGLRHDRDVARHPLPAAGRAAQARLGRAAAAPARRRGSSIRTTRASSCRSAQPGELAVKGPQVFLGYWGHDAGDRSGAAHRRTAGCSPATSCRWTTRAGSPSSTARRT